jgi:hypothetical protein
LGITDRTSDGKPLGYRALDWSGNGCLKDMTRTAFLGAMRARTDNVLKRTYRASLSRTQNPVHARLTTQRKLVAMLRHARSQAILSGAPVAVSQDAEGNLRLSYRQQPYHLPAHLSLVLEAGPGQGDGGNPGEADSDTAFVREKITGKIGKGVIVGSWVTRGDPPKGETAFIPPADGYAHANELVGQIRRYREHGFPGFGVAVAGYPEKHIEAPDLATDLNLLKRKVDAGVEFLITQLFFDNRFYFDFVDRARAAWIAVPIIPGIMPITNLAQAERMTTMCGAAIPPALFAELDRRRDDAVAAQQLGVAQATAQCVDLLNGGAPGIHFYTLNRSHSTWVVFENLKAALPATVGAR